MRNKYFVLGYFGFENSQLDGQTIKSRNILELIKRNLKNKKKIKHFDTQVFRNSKLAILKMIWSTITCSKLIYIPAENNLKYYMPD